MANPWFPFYMDDYERKTSHLSLLERGAYSELIRHYYMTGGPLPANALQVHRICRATEQQERDAIDYCLGYFFRLESDGYHHDRCDEELAKSRAISEKRTKSALSRHSKSNAIVDANAHANAEQLHTQLQPHLHKEKPSAKNAEIDSRHSAIRDFVKHCITHATKLDPAPWNGRDAKALSAILKSNPSWDVEVFKNLIRNRFRSEGVPGGDPAYKWLPELSKYADGPLNQFGKVSNGTNQPAGSRSLGKQSDRNEANRDAILVGIFGPNAGRDAAPGSGPGQNDTDPLGVGHVGKTGARLLT